MNLPPSFQVKLVWDKRNEIRRFILNAPYSFDQVKHHVNNLLFAGNEGQFSLKYEDEDKDWITFSTNEELIQALHISSSSNLLRLALEETDVGRSQPPSYPNIYPPSYPNTYQPPQFSQPPQFGQIPGPQFPQFTPQQRYQPPPFRSEWEHRGYNRYEQKAAKRAVKQEFRDMKRNWKENNQTNESKLIARFVRHVTIEDDTKLTPSFAFTKVWRFRNDGRIPWPDTFQLLFVSKRKGDQMSGPDSIPFHTLVNCGDEFDATANLVSPPHPGCYVGYWRLADMNGKKFGQRVRVKILVQPWDFQNPLPTQMNY